MEARKSISLLAFVLACSTSATATFGMLFHYRSEIGSPDSSLGEHLMMIGTPGFVVGAMVTGGHRTTFTAMAISGTILNAGLYFLVWFGILKFVQVVSRKTT